jgi:RecB family endonuclease NucS
VRVILDAIKHSEQEQEETLTVPDRLFSADEVAQTIEKDIEEVIAKKPSLLGKGLRLKRRQLDTGPSGRIDLLLKDGAGNLVVVELKYDWAGRKALAQLQRYIHWLKNQKGTHGKKVRGIIVCKGVMPAFQEDMARLKGVRVYCYGWQLKVEPWRRGA